MNNSSIYQLFIYYFSHKNNCKINYDIKIKSFQIINWIIVNILFKTNFKYHTYSLSIYRSSAAIGRKVT